MPSISTPLAKKIGLRFPIVAAPMFIISNREMLVASAEAGILGAIPSLNERTAEGFRDMLAWVRQKTDRPIAVNLAIKLTDPERLDKDFQACLDHGVNVIITSYGNPTELAKRAHDKKLTVFHDVINLKHAKKAEEAGADAIIGVAAGAGGHAGAVSPYVLFPWLGANLKVPIVAAGCIATGRQLAASLALGAELAYMGTRFIASNECGADAKYKEMTINGSPDDIVYTDEVSGVHANFIHRTLPPKTNQTKEENQRDFQGQNAAKRWRDIWSAGQGIALAHEIKPIGAIVEEIVREYVDATRALPTLEA